MLRTSHTSRSCPVTLQSGGDRIHARRPQPTRPGRHGLRPLRSRGAARRVRRTVRPGFWLARQGRATRWAVVCVLSAVCAARGPPTSPSPVFCPVGASHPDALCAGRQSDLQARPRQLTRACARADTHSTRVWHVAPVWLLPLAAAPEAVSLREQNVSKHSRPCAAVWAPHTVLPTGTRALVPFPAVTSNFRTPAKELHCFVSEFLCPGRYFK